MHLQCIPMLREHFSQMFEQSVVCVGKTALQHFILMNLLSLSALCIDVLPYPRVRAQKRLNQQKAFTIA